MTVVRLPISWTISIALLLLLLVLLPETQKFGGRSLYSQSVGSPRRVREGRCSETAERHGSGDSVDSERPLL